MIKHYDQKELVKEKVYFIYTSRKQSITEENEAGAEADVREECCLLVFSL